MIMRGMDLLLQHFVGWGLEDVTLFGSVDVYTRLIRTSHFEMQALPSVQRMQRLHLNRSRVAEEKASDSLICQSNRLQELFTRSVEVEMQGLYHADPQALVELSLIVRAFLESLQQRGHLGRRSRSR